FEEMDRQSTLAPEDLDRWGEAAWWCGRIDDSITVLERAFSLHIDAGDRRTAGLAALRIAENHFHKLAGSVGKGWIAQAQRLLADEEASVEHGWLVRMLTVLAFEEEGDAEKALELSGRAHQIGRRLADPDLTALTLHDRGRVLVALGRVEEGMSLMDEAMAAAVGGSLGAMATGRIYCNMITVCEQLSDFRRAGEWSEEATRWCERAGSDSGFPGICRVKRASITRLRGSWGEAESEARRALDELRDFLDFSGAAWYEMGEVRRHRGDLTGAESAFREANEMGTDPQPGLARLRLAEGKSTEAARLISRALAESSQAPLNRAKLLPTQVEVALAAGDLGAATAAAEELATTAAAFGSRGIEAAAAHSRGRVAMAEDNAAGASTCLREAWKLWQEVGLPYEAAVARELLGIVYLSSGEPESADLELEAAAAAFARLGAELDLRRVTDTIGRTGDEPAARVAETLMFTDIVRSTELIGAIGDEAWEQLVGWHHDTLRAAFAHHAGREVDAAGDGFFVAFPDAEGAVSCAQAIQRTLAKHRHSHGFAPRVRIGLHATVVGPTRRGRGVHEAARIAGLGDGDDIVASTATVEGLDVTLGERRTVTLKGIEEPVEVVTVAWR
ncbi:MAG: adenylate/guanylate cyclase domain-containing protein, partial [Acidimicrobiia bacterium]